MVMLKVKEKTAFRIYVMEIKSDIYLRKSQLSHDQK